VFRAREFAWSANLHVQARALRRQPGREAVAAAVVQARQQRAAVGDEGVDGPAGRHRLPEVVEVGRHGPAQVVAARLQIGRPRELARTEHDLAQVAPRRRFVVLGPQQRGEAVAFDPAAVERQVGQQLEAPLVGEGHAGAALLDGRRTHQQHARLSHVGSIRRRDTRPARVGHVAAAWRQRTRAQRAATPSIPGTGR
jgi:hypothetical protein